MRDLQVTCNECAFSGSILAVSLHRCEVQRNGGRCEDYPACGHTDGDGCQTLPEHTKDYWMSNPHLMCDHEAGDCITGYEEYEDCEEEEEDN